MISKSILNNLVNDLKAHNIVWGIGGSYLLQLYNLYDNPNDLDLWVNPDDMFKVKKIFNNCEEIKTDINLPPQFHYKIKYYDAEIDFVACFITKPNKNEFKYNIVPDNIHYMQTDDGLKVPCTYLEDWYVIYKLLKREDKAKIIKDFFSKNKREFSEKIIETSLSNPQNVIPKGLQIDVNDFMFSILQISLLDI